MGSVLRYTFQISGLMQRRTWIGIGILVGVVLLIALIVGLVVGLRKHKKKDSPDSGPSLDDILSNDSTFPNGSYQVSTGSLKAGPENLNPILVTLEDLKSLGLIVDNSSLVAETNRLSVMFVRIPRNGTARVQFGGIGVRFGSSDTLNVVPLNLSSILNSGLRYIGLLKADRSDVYQVQVRMAEEMCANSASGSCSIVNWSPYFVFGDNLGSAANFSNELPVACGSQCDANSTSRCATSCSACDGQQVAGANTPVTRRYRMNTTSARNLLFSYQTYQVPDRVTVTYGGVNLFDSTCIGTNDEKLTPITYEGHYSEVRVDVEPNCDGTNSTQWYFTLPCAGGCQGCDEYSCLDNQRAHCGSDGYLKRYGWYFCESYYDSYQKFDEIGKNFINCVRPKLLSYVQSYLKVKGDVNCTDLSNKAFSSYTAIYAQCGFCSALSTNKLAFSEVLVAWRNLVSPDVWSQLGTTFCKCAYCIPGVCSNC